MTDTQENASVFTLGLAAKEVGLAKSTVHTAIKNGKLSASKVDGIYQIQAAELFRVWPRKSREKEPESAGAALVHQAVLEVKLEASERENQQLKTQLEDTRIERDKWADGFANEQAKSTQYRLDYQQEKEANLAAKSEPQKEPNRSAITPWILGVVLIALAAILADRFGMISLLELTGNS